MSRLIFAGFSRLKKELSFWLGLCFMFIAGIYISVNTTKDFPLEKVFFLYVVVVGLVLAVFCSLYLGIEHGDGTMRNKIITGHTKTDVYLSNLIVCISVGILFCVAFMIPMLTIGIARLGVFSIGALEVLLFFCITLLVSAAYSAIYVMISLLIQNKAIITVVCLLSFIILICVDAKINSRLQQGPYRDDYVMSIDGISKVQNEPNPNYISGTKREIYQFVLDFLPTGQALQFVELTMVHTWQLPMYSLIVFVLTSMIGVMIFRKMNIK